MRIRSALPAIALGVLTTVVQAADGPTARVAVVPAVTDVWILPDSPAPAGSGTLRLTAAPGEYEPASFVIFAESALADVTVTVSDLVAEEDQILPADSLDVRIVKRWFQSNFGRGADKSLRYLTPELLVYNDDLIVNRGTDSFVRLPDGAEVKVTENADLPRRRIVPSTADFPVADAASLLPFDIAAGSNRQLWVTLHTDASAEPGLYAGQIELAASGESFAVVPVEVEVLPIVLAEPGLEISIYYRGVLDDRMPEGSISAESKSEAQYLAELRNMAAHGINSPTVYQTYGSGKLRRVLELWQEAGLSADNLYYLGVNVVSRTDGVVPAKLAEEVRTTLRLAREFGFKDVYFYGRDEAVGEGVVYQYPYWDEVQRVGGKIMVAGWQSSADRLGNFDITGGREDLFACLGTLRAEEAARWKATGSKIYSYQNPTGGEETPETYRRNYGLLLWQKGYDGAVPYAYQDGEARTWFDFDSMAHRDAIFAYPTVEKPIDTLQWEGFREGVDDLRYLQTLQLALSDASGAVAEEARNWLERLRGSALAQQDLDQIRAIMTGYILALRESPRQNTTILSHSVGPVSAAGTAVLRWETAARSTGAVVLRGPDGVEKSYRTAVHARNHSVELESLEPRNVYEYSITVDGGAEVVSAPVRGTFRVYPGIVTRLASADVTDTAVRYRAGISSDYEASVALDIDESLLGWWRFSTTDDGEVADSSGRDNPAELQADAALVAGRFGNGVLLDGEDDYIAMPDIEVAENGTATIEGWFRFDRFAMDVRKNQAVLSGLYQHASNNHFYFVRTNDYFYVGDLLERGEWHHIALSWSGDTSTATMYIDGRARGAVVQGNVDGIPAINGLSIGRSGGVLSRLLSSAKGSLAASVDEIRVWNRVLSPAEVMATYRAGRETNLEVTVPSASAAASTWTVHAANAADSTLQPVTRDTD